VSSLQQQEEDFFNQKTLENGGGDKGRLTKDSILALYGSAPTPSIPSSFQQYPGVPQDQFFVFGQQPGASLFTQAQPQQAFQQPQQQQQAAPMFNGNFSGLGGFNSTMQAQQINKLNEENIKKIESFNFNNNNFK
jgi:hypothetical protein